jgi:protein-disulfide isomerase
MAAHITGLVLAALVIWQAPKQFDKSIDARRVIGNWPAIGVPVLGLMLAGIMAGGQVYFKPSAVFRGGESQNTPPTIDPHQAPLVGSPDAPYAVTLLFDYNCAHCQKLHSMLEEVIQRSHGKLAVVLCPTPLNPRCNPYVPQEVDEFKDSCELVKIALAVYVAKREAFPDFDRWMFSFESGDHWQPRTLDAATAKAIQLLGETKFNAALADPWVEQYLQNTIRIYGATTTGGNNAVPKFVFGSHWVIPQPNDVNDLISILRDNLAVPMP